MTSPGRRLVGAPPPRSGEAVAGTIQSRRGGDAPSVEQAVDTGRSSGEPLTRRSSQPSTPPAHCAGAFARGAHGERRPERGPGVISRAAVFARDRGVCALCGCDTEELRVAYYAAICEAHAAHENRCLDLPMQVQKIASALKLQGELRAIDQRLRALGFKPKSHFWEWDHTKPLVLGGGNALGNARTLCRPCHRRVTADLRRVLANRPTKRVAIHGEDRRGRPVVL